MRYNTPELLLVGAAQNLVLGSFDKTPETNCLEPGDLYTVGPIELNW